MRNMGGYHDHYLKKESFLLADVFEKFTDTCLKFYGLDLSHYFSLPGLSWDAMLKMTGVKIKKISDDTKYLFIEKALNGGISCIAKRYAKGNNKYMKNYNPKKPSKFIIYLDMNNLCGWKMSEYLPNEGFKWLKNVDGFDVTAIGKKVRQGIFLKLILNILMNYVYYRMIIHQPQKKLQCLVKSCHKIKVGDDK